MHLQFFRKYCKKRIKRRVIWLCHEWRVLVALDRFMAARSIQDDRNGRGKGAFCPVYGGSNISQRDTRSRWGRDLVNSLILNEILPDYETSLQCCRKGLSVTLLSTGAASSSRSTWVKPDKFGPPLPSPLWPLLLDTCGQWLGTLGSYWWSWWHFYILWDLYFEWIYQRVCSHCCCQCLLTCRCCCCKFLTVDFCTLFIWVKVWDSGWSIYTYAKQISDSGAFFDPKLIMIMKWFGKL